MRSRVYYYSSCAICPILLLLLLLLYADDIQIFVSFPPNQTQASEALRKLEKCIADIDAWMKSNSLQLNHSKCEFMLFGSKSQSNNLDIDSISNIGFIRKYLTRSATEKLVYSLISSRLDFGNGLLYNLPNSQIAQLLQKLQNAAARIVSLSSKRSHITPILKTVHWLPVKERIIFKILLFVLLSMEQPLITISLCYDCTNLHEPYDPPILVFCKFRFPKSWGERAFAHAGPALWNSLPQELKDSNS